MDIHKIPYCHKCGNEHMFVTGDVAVCCAKCGKAPCSYELWLCVVPEGFKQAIRDAQLSDSVMSAP